MISRKSSLPLAIAAIGLLYSNAALSTNGYFTHGVGSVLKGMAGAGVGSNADMGPMVVANNPALGIFAADRSEFGLAAFSPLRSYTASSSLANGQGGAFTVGAGEYESSSNLFPIPYFARNWSLANDRALTLMAYGRGGMNTDWDDSSATAMFDPDGPGPASAAAFPGPFGGGDAGVDLSQLFLSVNYAGQFRENITWGIGPIVAVQAFEATGVGAFAPYTESFAESGGTLMPDSLNDNGHDTAYGIGLSLGFWWGISETVSAGLSYQSRMDMTEFDDYSDLFARGGSFDIPASIKAGLSFKASSDLRLNLDVEHTQFAEIDSVGNPMARIGACPTAGLGGTSLSSCLGGHDGAGFGWSDMTTYKLGAEWQLSDRLTWRFGYSTGEQPISAPDTMFNILAPGVIEQHFTTGFSFRRDSGRDINVAFMFAPEKEVKGANMFDPTQSLDLKMRQFEIEFSFLF